MLDKLKKKKEELYVGKQKVKDYSINEQVDLVGVLYENGKNSDFTIEQWEAVKSTTEYDDAEVSFRKFKNLIKEILGLMAKERVTLMGDRQFILQEIDGNLNTNYQLAIAKLFNVKGLEEIMLTDIDRVLKENS